MDIFLKGKKFLLLIVFLASISFITSIASAQSQITISTSVPGTYNAAVSGGAPGAFVADFYWFALSIGGLLAFGAIVYGGVKYMASAGNPSGQSDAKEWIEAALFGLLLLVGAYFVLSVVNPQLLNLNLPSLTPINISSIVVPGNAPGSANGPGVGGNAEANQIAAAAAAYRGTSTAGGPGNGTVSCAWAVNNVLANAGIAPVDSDSVQSMENALIAGRGTLVNPSQAQPGDIVIQAQDGHVGICANVGCTQVISNSSSRASFSWISNTSFNPSYNGGPGRIYQLNS